MVGAGRRVGVMGGTFDPVHNGHLLAAAEVAGKLALDKVLFVPTGQPWQKTDGEVSDAEDRYAMTLLATAGNPAFEVSRVDIDRPGATYTVDTLRDLRAVSPPKTELFFITGADALGGIRTWKGGEELFHLARFVGVSRPGYDLLDIDVPPGAVELVEIPQLDISSTDCRRRVAEGRPLWGLVPDDVVRYIARRGLYRA
ncbi:nicotinate-nucleotide adenylyltransferase [Phytomonospora endophytica]|uniref:Probable nicotinate-nucleotide adenylyltransferase n=1 Tax=Phytomonospora endophytica TaxID=714109 RepID=A0A841FJM4_9ACTN|nr:nicotinate-nucleotide adenylyltransferase [Phytomonospora endophytica]MBB6034038.1 nicotinate-nucleotide adenylyltransferase [Phytomonospora endophytica]GIG71574.1 putative nicotinate-nucleotide adenylyltransferase [Phytomonospora endophytica]